MSPNPIGIAVDYWMSDISKHYEKACCIAASTIVSDALEYFGVDAKPMAADIIIYNAEAVKQRDQGVPISEWPDEAWSLGSDHDLPTGGPGYDGHLVMLLEDAGFVDLTCNQYNKLFRNISVEAPIWLPLPEGYEMGSWMEVDRDDGSLLAYRLRPDQTRWKHTKDYRSPNRKRYAGEIIRHVRGVMRDSAAPYPVEGQEVPLG